MTVTSKAYLFVVMILVSAIAANKSFAQISYPDSCLRMEWFYGSSKTDTIKTVQLRERDIPAFFLSKSISLNVHVTFTNSCDQAIVVPSVIRLDMPGQDQFAVEGYLLSGTRTDTLTYAWEHDYQSGSASGQVLQAKKTQSLPFGFPLGFNADKKGLYKFRLRFFNEYNHIPFDQWKYYYSNWIYLAVK